MYTLDEAMYVVDNVLLENQRKRHIIGGALISIGILCFGLAITAITLQEE